MLNKSEFKSDTPAVCLDLCGSRFFVALDGRTAECCEKLLDGARKRLGAMQDGTVDRETSDEGICRFLSDGLDGLLGKGAVRKVFGKKAVGLENITALMCFVLTALGKAQ
ncbi:MAG: hypothetical protein E7401_03425 [Ruminococcaceae bacterium]|nr:hypothetical protein [Oscillospiraceae bacterium]